MKRSLLLLLLVSMITVNGSVIYFTAILNYSQMAYEAYMVHLGLTIIKWTSAD